jgi:hypothetical protein
VNKNWCLLLIAVSAISLTACRNRENDSTDTKHFPVPGTVVASAQMPVVEDSLNHFTFSVKVIADSNVSKGIYDVDADFGPNYAAGQFTMPKGGEYLKPEVRRGKAPYTFIIGFRPDDDTAFNDYFEVSSNNSSTKMQYIKAYIFE